MANLRTQNFIYRNLVRRPLVNRALNGFGRVINGIGLPYATGLTRNKATLFASLTNPTIAKAERNAAHSRLADSTRKRAHLAVLEAAAMYRVMPKDESRQTAEKLEAKGIKVSAGVLSAVLKNRTSDQVVEIFQQAQWKVRFLERMGGRLGWAFEIIPVALESNNQRQVLNFVGQIAERVGKYLGKNKMAGWMFFLELPTTIKLCLRENLTLDQIVDLFDQFVFTQERGLGVSLRTLVEALQTIKDEGLTSEQLFGYVDQYVNQAKRPQAPHLSATDQVGLDKARSALVSYRNTKISRIRKTLIYGIPLAVSLGTGLVFGLVGGALAVLAGLTLGGLVHFVARAKVLAGGKKSIRELYDQDKEALAQALGGLGEKNRKKILDLFPDEQQKNLKNIAEAIGFVKQRTSLSDLNKINDLLERLNEPDLRVAQALDRIRTELEQVQNYLGGQVMAAQPEILITKEMSLEVNIMEVLTPGVVDQTALSLRDQVRLCGQQLLFTRNISFAELVDIAQTGQLRVTPREPTKYFRYGLGSEYGGVGEVLTVVMKRGFWEEEKQASRLGNIFLDQIRGREINKKIIVFHGSVSREKVLDVFGDDPSWQGFFIDPASDSLSFKENAHLLVEAAPIADEKRTALVAMLMEMQQEGFKNIEESIDRDNLLTGLAKGVEYNKLLSLNLPDQDPNLDSFVGKSVLVQDKEKFMGNFPQLEVKHGVELDQVEQILVPEHMWEQVASAVQQNPEVQRLLQKVAGTGETEEAFLEGQGLLARRSRMWGGRFEPSFGNDSFHAFEQEFFKLVLSAEDDQASAGFIAQAQHLMQTYGYQGSDPYHGWIWATTQNGQRLSREQDDWKMFVNPREEHFFDVLGVVLQVLAEKQGLGIIFKIPPDLAAEWRAGRTYGGASNTPKIVIYLNEQTLPGVAHAIAEHLSNNALASAGFGNMVGPSFTRRYVKTDLIFYKMEDGNGGGGDRRAKIGNEVMMRTNLANVESEAMNRYLQGDALARAGYGGENFYAPVGTYDPIIRQTIK